MNPLSFSLSLNECAQIKRNIIRFRPDQFEFESCSQKSRTVSRIEIQKNIW